MLDWSTAASLATALGTLVLALEYGALLEAVRGSRVFAIELLYSDHEGGQRAIGRFAVAPVKESVWLCSVVRHWNLDRPDPR
jgi:hypothetical protein